MRIFGGPKTAVPSCQMLPPGFPAYVAYCPYTKNPGSGSGRAPDLAKAKALVKQSGTAGQKVAIVGANDETTKGMLTYLQSVLNSIGYKATIKPLSSNISFTYMQNTKNKVQISISQWYQDYPAAVGLPQRPARLRLVPSRQRHEHQHLGLLQQDGRRRHAEGAPARHRGPAGRAQAVDEGRQGRSRTTPRRPCSSTRA